MHFWALKNAGWRAKKRAPAGQPSLVSNARQRCVLYVLGRMAWAIAASTRSSPSPCAAQQRAPSGQSPACTHRPLMISPSHASHAATNTEKH